jgi:hypothetical protein
MLYSWKKGLFGLLLFLLGLAPLQALVINELDADTAGTDALEFVELFGTPNQSLDGYVLVFFNGANDLSYAAFDLDGYTLNADGFFVLGNAGVANVEITFAGNFLQNGADAVALYQADGSDFPDSTAATDTNLVDAIVYDTNDNDDTALLALLTPGQPQINEDDLGDKDNHAIARIPDGGLPLITNTYVPQSPTPGTRNQPLPSIVINEVDADQSGTDAAEFVELFGPANTPLDGLVVVFINGSNDLSYAAFDLDGYTLNADGFFVLGNAGVANVEITFAGNFLQNGTDAVALYQADASDFPNDTAATDTNLVDAIVYDTNDNDDTALLALLTPGQPQINEGGQGSTTGHSNSRVPDGGTGRVTSTYVQQDPTPGASNSPVFVVINEVDSDTPGNDTAEFVELFGTPGLSLDGHVLAFFNGSNDSLYTFFDLTGYALDVNGFFVLGNAAVANVDIIFSDNTLQNGADAVALFQADVSGFALNDPIATVLAANPNLVDALVYDTNDGDDTGLLVLTPGQPQIDESGGGDKDNHSNSRLPDGGTALNTSSYVQQTPTPGVTNVLPTPTLSIAEIQGTGLASPYDGLDIRTEGNIVTHLSSNGFYMQA